MAEYKRERIEVHIRDLKYTVLGVSLDTAIDNLKSLKASFSCNHTNLCIHHCAIHGLILKGRRLENDQEYAKRILKEEKERDHIVSAMMGGVNAGT